MGDSRARLLVVVLRQPASLGDDVFRASCQQLLLLRVEARRQDGGDNLRLAEPVRLDGPDVDANG